MSEWGVPDWRDPAAYGDVRRWGFDRWRWEFYRRRDDLRACFDALKDQFPEPRFRHDEPGFSVIVSRQDCAKYGYPLLPNPRLGAQPMDLISTYQHDGLWHGAGMPSRLGPHEEALVFDLNRPIGPQLAHARDMLLGMQSALHGGPLQRRRHPGKWLGYLRTLDAREDEASWAEIAALHPRTAKTEQTARDVWEQARALCFNF